MFKKFTYTVLFVISCFTLTAQDLDSLINLNAFTEESELQKILNKNVAVSAQNLAGRETPGIISVITAEEIRNSGARDMVDVLRMVPGFDVLQDLQFVMGIGLRGSWANEGKVLVLMDGQPFNELLYQTVAIGNRFPVDAIERIEIIRGPGSAIYGGSAEYGVINIITKAAESLNGVAAYGTAGFHADAVGRTNGGVMAAQKGEKFSWDFSLFKGNGIVSDQQYQDIFQSSDPVDLSKTTNADPMNINAGFRYKGLSVRTMYDKFETSDPSSNVSFEDYYLDVQYKVKISDKVRITPRLQYLHQIPWRYDYPDTPGPDFDVKAVRTLGQLDGEVDVTRKINISFGTLYFKDQSTDRATDETMLTLNNFAIYAQALFKHRLANATVGFRFEKNNRYDGAFVPRLALTKKIENLHFKILYSKAFRSPSLQNVQLDTTGAKPERSNVFEIELGYQFTPEMLLAVNAFSISTKDVIIYGSQGEGDSFEEWYESSSKSGSRGMEVVYSIRKKAWYGQLTYSFSQAINDNTVDSYVVSQTNKQYAGMLAHKITLNANFNLTPKLTLNPTFIFGGKRYAFTEIDLNGDPISTELDPYVLSNIFLNYNDLLPGLTLGAGVYDLLNQRPGIPQAYNGGAGAYGPIPGRSREYVVKLSYQINFKK
ncbi:MAG TPA: TonB-dependent receptor plug domain-containing protein [Chryseolinea sp.]|nr:TonB-dependent receptor plug domain-containing protein [Chryseolinea sp.]